MNQRANFIFLGCLIVVGALLRIVPHPANVAPIGALALISGAVVPYRWKYAVPLVALAASDLFLGRYHSGIMGAVYGSFAVSVMIGSWLKQSGWLGGRNIHTAHGVVKKRKFGMRALVMVMGASLAGSLFFFLVTNAAVWAFGSMYLHTGAGLMESYLAALPFFRNTVVGDLSYTGVFFGMYYGMMRYSRRIKSSKNECRVNV